MAATLSSVVWVIGVVVVIVAAFVGIVLRRRSTAPAAVVPVVGVGPVPVDEPMTGLESALSRVTDRSGRPLREHIDAEQPHVDELRVPDDTGPLLRRVLDHIEQRGTRQHGTGPHGAGIGQVPGPPPADTD